MSSRSREADEYNERFLALLRRRPWIRQVVIVSERDVCAACQAQPSLVEVRDLPALPHLRCTTPDGCSCWYAASSEIGDAARGGGS